MADNKTRILFLDLGSHFGGVEVYTTALAEILGPHATLFALCSLPKLASDLRERGAQVICIPILGSKWLKGLRLLLAFIILPYMIVRYRVDIVQMNGYFESALLIWVRLLNRQAIYTMHGPFEIDLYHWYRNPERFFPRYLSRICLRLSSKIVCVSEAVGDIARTTLPANKINVIPNWVSMLPSRPKYQFNLHLPARLLFAGRVEKYKGLHLVFQAIKDIPGIELIVIGDGSYRHELEGLSNGLNVRFEGFQPNTSEYYEAADVFVNPSLGPEGLPLVSLEAMAYGVPCLFSDLPVHREITGSGNAGYLFKAGDADDLRLKLIELLSSEELRDRLSKNALERVESRYSRKAAGKQYSQLFRVPAN